MENQQLKHIVEGALLAAGRSLSIKQLLDLFDLDYLPEQQQLEAVLAEIAEDCADRGFELKQTASGYRFQVRQHLAPWINRLWDEKPKKYSRAVLETLSLIAYRQPLTRGDIEDVRGVSVSSEIIKTLLEREWIRVVGHRDVPGRPSLYATTKEFLDYFSLASLEELPALSDIKDIEELAPELALASTDNEDEQSQNQSEQVSEQVPEEDDDLEASEQSDTQTESRNERDIDAVPPSQLDDQPLQDDRFDLPPEEDTH